MLNALRFRSAHSGVGYAADLERGRRSASTALLGSAVGPAVRAARPPRSTVGAVGSMWPVNVKRNRRCGFGARLARAEG